MKAKEHLSKVKVESMLFFLEVFVVLIIGIGVDKAAGSSNASSSMMMMPIPPSSPPQCEDREWPNFLCTADDNACFTIQDKCDGYSDCINAEDECHSMCVETFRCQSTSRGADCVAMDRFCNGIVDCDDGSDEVEVSGDGDGFTCYNAWQMSVNISDANWQHWKEKRVPWNIKAQEWLGANRNIHQKKCRLPDHLVCDGINHCGDHSDECSDNAGCGPEKKFFCNNTRCISKANFCDGRNDCGDNSDECHQDCPRNFRCKHGSCISMSQFCDGIVDCEDGSDEVTEEVSDDEYFNGSMLCSNIANRNSKRCLIPSIYLCDGLEQCYDREDECTKGCEFSFVCPDGKCFTAPAKCDGIAHCADMSDECNPDCEVKFHCNNETCLSFDRFCDGKKDCVNGEDEVTEDGEGILCVNKYSDKKSPGACVLPTRYVCDGAEQCIGRVDECQNQCDVSFYCDNDQTCLSPDKFYDGVKDCKDGSDEPGFGLKLHHQRGFKCRISRNGEIRQYVLPQKFLYDDKADCIDYTDLCFHEDSATGYRSASNCTRCLVATDVLISQRQICDGVFDCPDLSDECLCSDSNTPQLCQHVCFDVVLDDKCLCPLGQIPCMFESELNPEATKAGFNESVKCIPVSSFCNGVADCPGGSDERSCDRNLDSTAIEAVEIMQCSQYQDQNKWAPSTAFRCDNKPECFNMEDECDSNCAPVPGFCAHRTPAGFFNCPDNQIIPGKLVCNGRPECGVDPADERYCPDRFFCLNGSNVLSIEKEKVCDFTIDCEYESDEKGCPDHFYCEDDKVPYFIHFQRVMDGRVDCSDGSDECPKLIFKDSIFSSHQFLIKETLLQFMIWIMGLIATFGNICVLWHTIFVLKHPAQYKLTRVAVINNMLVLNLAAADLLMGSYLLYLAGENVQTSGKYCHSDREWRSGVVCQFLGVIVTLSSEVSLITLAILASYRLYCVVRPIQSREMKLRKTLFNILCSWTVGLLLALLPTHKSYQDYFTSEVWMQNNSFFTNDIISRKRMIEFCEVYMGYNSSWVQGFSNETTFNPCYEWENLVQSAQDASPSQSTRGYMGYYSAHAICLPKMFMNIGEQSWEFSFAVTMLNFLICLYIVIIYGTLWSTRHVKKSSISTQSTKNLQKRIALLVSSDCACWLPISSIAFLQFAGVQMPPSTYAFTAIILLPINSALNPIFYSNALQNLYRKFITFLQKFEAFNKLRRNIRHNIIGKCTNKRGTKMVETETSLLPTTTRGPESSRIITELTYDFSSLPESTV